MPNLPGYPNRVQVHVNHPSPEGLAVMLRFLMQRRDAFSYIVFIDAQGNGEVSGAELLRAFEEENSLFPMDFADPRTNSIAHISATVMQPHDVENAIAAFRMYRDHLSYLEDYETNLVRALDRSREVSRCAVKVTTS